MDTESDLCPSDPCSRGGRLLNLLDTRCADLLVCSSSYQRPRHSVPSKGVCDSGAELIAANIVFDAEIDLPTHTKGQTKRQSSAYWNCSVHAPRPPIGGAFHGLKFLHPVVSRTTSWRETFWCETWLTVQGRPW